MVAALPVQDCMNDLAVAAHDDLRDRSAQNTLARRSRRGGMRPGALEIGTERDQLLPLRLTKRRRAPRDHGRGVALALGNRLQSLVPSALQLAGDEPIGWINSIVLSTGMGDLIAGLLQGEFQLPLSRRGLARLGFDRLDRSFHTKWLQDAQHLLGDRCIDAQATHRDASLGAVVHARAIAVIATELAAVVHMEFAAAVAAAQKPSQQQLAFAGCSARERAAHAGRVVGDCFEVAFELGKGALFAPCPRGCSNGGHAPLCPPYAAAPAARWRTASRSASSIFMPTAPR